MGMDLSGKGGYFRWGGMAWCDVLELAIQFGWEPMGTQPGASELRCLRYRLRKRGKSAAQIKAAVARGRKSHPGHYGGNDGQEVCAADAKNLAAALSRATDAGQALEAGGAAIRARRRKKAGKRVRDPSIES